MGRKRAQTQWAACAARQHSTALESCVRVRIAQGVQRPLQFAWAEHMQQAARAICPASFAGAMTRLVALAQASGAPLLLPMRCVVGVSGGADSLALCLLLDEYARAHPSVLSAPHGVTVHHGLRSEAQSEAEWVASELGARGISHEIVHRSVRRGPTGWRGTQEAARAVRGEALALNAARRGATAVLLAHQQDDQLETALIRAAAASGLDGLACMAPWQPRWRAGAAALGRPLLLLPASRACVERTLIERFALTRWVNDPSNESASYVRTHARRALAAWPQEQRVRAAALVAALGALRAAAEGEAQALLAEAEQAHTQAAVTLDRAVLRAARPTAVARALALAAESGGDQRYPCRARTLRLASERVRSAQVQSCSVELAHGRQVHVRPARVVVTRASSPRAPVLLPSQATPI